MARAASLAASSRFASASSGYEMTTSSPSTVTSDWFRQECVMFQHVRRDRHQVFGRSVVCGSTSKRSEIFSRISFIGFHRRSEYTTNICRLQLPPISRPELGPNCGPKDLIRPLPRSQHRPHGGSVTYVADPKLAPMRSRCDIWPGGALDR